MKKKIRLGAGAGYSGDRIEPAMELAEKGDIQYLVFECLAERTIAIAQQSKMKDPEKGFDALLEERMEKVLGICNRKGIKIITNMGAANPIGGMKKIVDVARKHQIKGLKVAAVTGDDVFSIVQDGDYIVSETGQQMSAIGKPLVSANAYLGATPIVEALRNGADVIITGRVADPCLFLAPLIFEFNWDMENWNLLGQGIVVGHLLECAGQITGGYFADPGFKDVPNLARLGFPIGEVAEDGTVIITKVADSGGRITTATCKEQLLYEIHNPAEYITPDVVADFTGAMISMLKKDHVRIQGGRGNPRTEFLKVCIGYVDSYFGEGQISYAGPGAAGRGQLARDIVMERLRLTEVPIDEIRADLIGVDSMHGPISSRLQSDPYELRLRVAGRTRTMKAAVQIANEVETLYTNGPAGGGGATKSAREIVAMVSTLIPRVLVKPEVHYEVIK